MFQERFDVVFYGYYQEIESKLKQVVMIQPGDAQFIDSATRIRRINWFFLT
uniref:Translation initiation factor 1 n=1 Tax=Foonchewia coriacea TaxID=1234228 RepID=A0A7M1LBW0_9GENT|nr:translation initiation factor 1 [Foonchewia coriacea]QOQ85932.1 translation initiation factor 1 [Foonchewia coriacea]